MKIPPLRSLTLPKNLTDSMKGEGIFRMRILARESPNRALAEINGTRVRAHFPDGIPPGDYIRIVRDGSRQDMAVFRILAEIPVRIPPSLFQRLRIAPDGSLTWPHSLSLISLLRSRKERSPDEPRVRDFLNRLRTMGISREGIRSFIRLLPGGEMMSFLEHLKGEIHPDGADFQDCITTMENLLTDDASPDEILQVISMFSQKGPFYENAMEDGEDFVPFELFYEKNTMVISVTFSKLGMIDIVALTDESAIRVHIIAESTDAADSLRLSLPQLNAELSEQKPPTVVTVTDRRNFIDEIREYKTNISRGGEINIQV